MSLRRLLALLPEGFEIVLADVGSAGGIKDRWLPAREIVAGLLFEPREGGEPRREGRDTLFPVALGAAPGRARLNLTALPNMSSTLEPNRPLLETFRKKGEHTKITGHFEMPVDTLDAVAARAGRAIDAIKVDTQGSELGILEGARACLGGPVFLAEVEVSFFERYAGQALFGDVEAFMRGAGFELIDLYRLKRYRRAERYGIANLGLGGGQRAGRLAYGDALFLLSEERLLARIAAEGEPLLLKALVGLFVYGKPDMAAFLFERAGEVVEPGRRAAIDRLFGALGRRRVRGRLHRIADALARRA